MAQEIKMSAAGLKAMQVELEYLKTVRRKELAEEIKEARSTATCPRTASTMRPRTPRVWSRTASPSWSRWSRTLSSSTRAS